MEGLAHVENDIELLVIRITVQALSAKQRVGNVNGAFAVRNYPEVFDPGESNSKCEQLCTSNGLSTWASSTFLNMHLRDVLLNPRVKNITHSDSRIGIRNDCPCGLRNLEVSRSVTCAVCVECQAILPLTDCVV